MNFFADARAATLKVQAMEAAVTHLQILDGMTKAQIDTIRDFEGQIWAAQTYDAEAGSLLVGEGAGPSVRRT